MQDQRITIARNVWPCLCLVFGLALAGAVGARAQDHAQAFIPATEDLPLMPGLTVVGEGGMVFDTPGGRILEVYATGDLPKAKVLRFYRETLPQLGWVRLAPGRHKRESEIFRIWFTRPDGAQSNTAQLTVRFTLKPETAK